MWSIGVVCYALFARELPFKGVNKDFDFASAEVNYDVIPPKFRPLIQQLLSVDPSQRPTAAEARGFHALNSSQTRRREPLSALAQPIVTDGAIPIVTRLSQVMKIQLPELLERLHAPEMNREKVLFLLLQRRFGHPEAVFKGPIYQRSEPTKELVSPGQSVMRTEFFPVPALAVYDALHSFVIRQRCCVSSPISATLIIGQPKDGKNLRIVFSVLDREGGGCAVTFIPDDESCDLSNMIMEHLLQNLMPAGRISE